MKSKSNKITIQRELKEKIPADVMKAINKACKGYGNTNILAGTAGVTTATIRRIKKEKTATPSTKSKIINALAELSEAA